MSMRFTHTAKNVKQFRQIYFRIFHFIQDTSKYHALFYIILSNGFPSGISNSPRNLIQAMIIASIIHYFSALD